MDRIPVDAVCTIDASRNMFAFVFQEPREDRWVAIVFNISDVYGEDRSFASLDEAYEGIQDAVMDISVPSRHSDKVQ